MFPFKLPKIFQEQIKTRSSYGFEYIGDPEKIVTGLTPRTQVMENGNHKLFFYPGKQEKNKPLLLIYSLINRPYIFDLSPGRSMIEYLGEQGFDVFLIDWGNPQPEDELLTMEKILKTTIHYSVKYIQRRYQQQKVSLLGYCMGATFATLYSGLFPELVEKMVLLTPPLGKDGSLLEKISEKMKFSDKFVNAGLISGRMLKLFFNSVRPAGALKKERDFWLNYDQEKFMEHFLPVEKWSNDTPDLPGQVFFEFMDLCFINDSLKNGQIRLGSSQINLSAVTCPVHSIAAEHDWIIPASALATVKEVLPNAFHSNYLLPGGHIGLVVGRTARKTWDEINHFLKN